MTRATIFQGTYATERHRDLSFEERFRPDRVVEVKEGIAEVRSAGIKLEFDPNGLAFIAGTSVRADHFDLHERFREGTNEYALQ